MLFQLTKVKMSNLNYNSETGKQKPSLSTYNVVRTTNVCGSCQESVNPKTVYTRYRHRFCSLECRDIFDERNDYGHETQFESENLNQEAYYG